MNPFIFLLAELLSALFLAFSGLRPFLGNRTWLVAPLVFAYLTVSFFGVAGLLIFRPTRAKFKTALSPLATAIVSFAAAPVFLTLGWQLYLWPHQAELDRFVQDLLAYGRITEMCDGQQYHKNLNGHIFDSGDQPIDSVAFPPLAAALQHGGIEPRQYDDFRRRLIQLGFMRVQAGPDYVAFEREGFLDNLHGVLWERSDRNLPLAASPDSTAFGYPVVFLRKLSGHWYLFITT